MGEGDCIVKKPAVAPYRRFRSDRSCQPQRPPQQRGIEMPRQSGRSCSDGAQVILLSPRSIRAASRRSGEVCVVASLQPSQSEQPE
jgi:hypothetical protein